jgi:hypothetical protein
MQHALRRLIRQRPIRHMRSALSGLPIPSLPWLLKDNRLNFGHDPA